MGSDVEKSLISMILFMLNFEVARCLQTNCWTKVIDPVSGRTCIHSATSKGCLSVAIALLTARADVNFPDPLEGKGTSFDGFPVCLCVDPKQFYLWALNSLLAVTGHLGAALYAQRRFHPRLPLHTAVEHGSNNMVGQLVQFKANVAVPIETRHVSSQKMWLPVPPADVDKDGKVTDRFKNAGTKAKKNFRNWRCQRKQAIHKPNLCKKRCAERTSI